MKFTYIQWIQYSSYKKSPFLYPFKIFIIIDSHMNLYR